eukprot:9689741-Alexandrium_andersonii.AAC.1
MDAMCMALPARPRRTSASNGWSPLTKLSHGQGYGKSGSMNKGTPCACKHSAGRSGRRSFWDQMKDRRNKVGRVRAPKFWRSAVQAKFRKLFCAPMARRSANSRACTKRLDWPGFSTIWKFHFRPSPSKSGK